MDVTNCPHCGSDKITINHPLGVKTIKCTTCKKSTRTNKKPKLSTLSCVCCGKLGVVTRLEMTCASCYYKQRERVYEYKGRIRMVLTEEQKDYFRSRQDELRDYLNLTQKQAKFFQEHPDEYNKQVTMLLS